MSSYTYESPIIMKIEGFDKWLWKHVSTTIKNKLGWVMSEFILGLATDSSNKIDKKKVLSISADFIFIIAKKWKHNKPSKVITFVSNKFRVK